MAGKTDIFGTPETAVENSSGVFDSFFSPETAYISSVQKNAHNLHNIREKLFCIFISHC